MHFQNSLIDKTNAQQLKYIKTQQFTLAHIGQRA